jgi:hypothetical protein
MTPAASVGARRPSDRASPGIDRRSINGGGSRRTGENRLLKRRLAFDNEAPQSGLACSLVGFR